MGRVGRSDQVDRVHFGGQPQADRQGDVGPDLGGDDPLWALGGQDQVQSEGSAHGGATQQVLEDGGNALREEPEFVHDDHHPRGPFLIRYLSDVGQAEFTQEFLPPGQFVPDALDHTLGVLPLQVGHERLHMRIGLPGAEGGSALEIEQNQP
jgi:hypothetical protein